MESIGHTHTHSGRNFHSYGTTVPPCVCVRRASKQETSMCTLHCKTLSIQNTLLLRCYSQTQSLEHRLLRTVRLERIPVRRSRR